MKSVALFFVVLALLAATGCTGRRAHPPSLKKGDVILAFGDSLTAGNGASPEQSYPAQLERITGLKVINAGVSGETTVMARKRLGAVLRRTHPAAIILCHGGNDFLQHLDPAVTRKNLRAMIRLARNKRIAVLLIGVPRPGLWLKSDPMYKKLAREYRLPYDGKILSRILSKSHLKSDWLHPNERGYRQLAEAVASLLNVPTTNGLPAHSNIHPRH